MRKKIVIVLICITLFISLFFYVKQGIEKKINESTTSLINIYKKQIFYTELGNHYDNLKSCDNLCSINNSYRNIFKTIDIFKIIENENKSDFEDVLHDYIILLYEFYKYLEDNNLDSKKEIIRNEINKFLKKREFISQIKVDYEILNIDSLEKYILDFRRTFPKSE